MSYNYIVYQHIRLDTNDVFYIGIGQDEKRPYSRFSRNRHWRFIVAKTDYRVQILSKNLTRKQAENKEIELIAFYGRKDLNKGNLVNMTDGGTGGLGLKHTENAKNKMRGRIPHNKNKKKHDWQIILNDIKLGMSETKLVNKHGCSKGTIYRIKQQYKSTTYIKN